MVMPIAYAYFVKQDALANFFEGQQTQDGAILNNGIPNNPKTVHRFMSKQE